MTTYTIQTGDTPFEAAKRLLRLAGALNVPNRRVLEATHRLRRVGGIDWRGPSGEYLWTPGVIVTLD